MRCVIDIQAIGQFFYKYNSVLLFYYYYFIFSHLARTLSLSPTFRLQVTQSFPVQFTLAAVQSVTSTPQASLGTTAVQGFENSNPRTTSGCTS